MKFLHLTDTHGSGRGPSSRTDNYMESIQEKFSEITQVIKTDNIEAVMHGGDLFDKPVVSMNVMGQIARAILATGVPWYVVPGNHDLFGYNIKSLPQTSLGLLAETGVVTILDRSYGPLEFTTPSGDTISFEGQEFHQDIDRRDPSHDYFVTSTSDRKVLIPHSMLLDKPYFPDVPHTQTKDLVDITTADLILVGHYHDGYPRYRLFHQDGRITDIFNPGSMIRDEASKGNLTRAVKYVIIDYISKDVWGFYEHEFKCAKPGVDIFDRSHITNKQAKDRYLQNFEQKLSDVKMDAVDVRDVLDKLIAKDGNIDKEIATEARDRLVQSEQVMDDVAKQMTGYTEKPANIHISEVVIRGFMSHDDTTVQLSSGFNAIIGPSDAGKSTIIRAVRFALYNEPKGAEFIRKGAKRCEVIVRFNDGSEIKRTRTSSSAGVYEITNSNGETTSLKGFSNNIPADVPNIHQMPVIQLTKDLETTLNIGYQLDTPFLIGESPGTRAAIIGRLTGVNLVDTAVREIGKDILGNTRDAKSVTAQADEVNTQLEAFTDLPEEKKRIDQVSGLIAKVGLAERIRQEYDLMDSEFMDIQQQTETYTQEAKDLDRILSLAPVVQQVEDAQRAREELVRIHEELTRAEEADRVLRLELTQVEQDLQYQELVDELLQKVAESSVLKSLQSDILKVTEEEKQLWQQEKTLPQVDPNLILQLEADMDTVSRIRQVKEENNNLLAEEMTIRKQLRIAYEEEGKAHQVYQNLLADIGVCPTCDQTIVRGHIHAN